MLNNAPKRVDTFFPIDSFISFSVINNKMGVQKFSLNYDRFMCPSYDGSMTNSVEMTRKDLFQLYIILGEMFEGRKPSDSVFQKEMNGCGVSEVGWPKDFMESVVGAWGDEFDEIEKRINDVK